MSEANELPIPREALGGWLAVSPIAGGGFEAVLENFFGAALRADLLARAALAAQSVRRSDVLRSLRAEWLAPAPPGLPISLRVSALGAAPGAPRLELTADCDAPIARIVASFAPTGGGLSYQDAVLPPDLPEPDAMPTSAEYARKEGWPEAYAQGPLEFRRVGALHPNAAAGESRDHVEWLRLRAPLPREPRIEAAALIFLAAFYDQWEFERRNERFDFSRFSVLSQSVWLHGALRPNEWLLLRASSRIARDGRAVGARELFARDGTLLATVASEALVAES